MIQERVVRKTPIRKRTGPSAGKTWRVTISMTEDIEVPRNIGERRRDKREQESKTRIKRKSGGRVKTYPLIV